MKVQGLGRGIHEGSGLRGKMLVWGLRYAVGPKSLFEGLFEAPYTTVLRGI